MAPVGSTALNDGVDGHVALGLKGERIISRIGKPLGRLQLQAPRGVRKISHRELHAFGAVDTQALFAQLGFVLGGAIGVVPYIPAAVAVGQVAVVQYVLGQGEGR